MTFIVRDQEFCLKMDFRYSKTFSLYNYAKLRYVDLEHILSQKSSVNVDWKSTFKRANNKNLQFLPNQADIMAILPTHELSNHLHQIS